MSNVPCRSVIYCATWGFCHRCAPNLADLQSLLLLSPNLDAQYDRGSPEWLSAVRGIQAALGEIANRMKGDIPSLEGRVQSSGQG